jgi:uncharacterized membrane protein
MKGVEHSMENQNRPKLDIPILPLQKFITMFSLILLIGNIAYIIIEWPALPEKFPGHFNAAGEVDRWGSKAEIWILPIIGLILWALLTILEKYPHIYNYINLTQQNAEKQYKYARMLLSAQKLFISISFVYLNVQSIQIAHNKQFGLGNWDLPVFLILILGSIAYYLFKVIRLK